MHLFDPSIEKYQTPTTKDLDLYIEGIGPRDEEVGKYGWKFTTLQTSLDKYSVRKGSRKMLKLDIEGDEFEVLAAMGINSA